MASKAAAGCLLLLLASAALAAPGQVPPAAAPPGAEACGVPAEVLAVRDAVQDDAGTGLDAADCPAGAPRLGPGDYHWGFLDAPGEAPAADLDDWYEVDLAARFGPQRWTMVNVTSAEAYLVSYHTVGLGVPTAALLHVPFRLALYPPGAAEPAHVIHSCGPGANFRNAHEGPWRFRLFRPALGEVLADPALAVPCGPDRELPDPTLQPPPGQTYGFYLGCKPHCDAFPSVG